MKLYSRIYYLFIHINFHWYSHYIRFNPPNWFMIQNRWNYRFTIWVISCFLSTIDLISTIHLWSYHKCTRNWWFPNRHIKETNINFVFQNLDFIYEKSITQWLYFKTLKYKYSDTFLLWSLRTNQKVWQYNLEV